MSILKKAQAIAKKNKYTTSSKLTDAELIDWCHVAIAILRHEVTIDQVARSQKLKTPTAYYKVITSLFHALSRGLITIHFNK